jgi:hypothetical protein
MEDRRIGSWYWAKSMMYQGYKVCNPEVHNDGSRIYCYYDSEYNAFTSVRTNGEISVYRYNDEDKHPAVPYGWEIYKENGNKLKYTK